MAMDFPERRRLVPELAATMAPGPGAVAGANRVAAAEPVMAARAEPVERSAGAPEARAARTTTTSQNISRTEVEAQRLGPAQEQGQRAAMAEAPCKLLPRIFC